MTRKRTTAPPFGVPAKEAFVAARIRASVDVATYALTQLVLARLATSVLLARTDSDE